MKFYYFYGEVPGNVADSEFIDRQARPQLISKLKFEFDGWLGADIVESIGTFIVTDRLKKAIEEEGLTGATFDVVEVVRTEMFKELYGDKELPQFHWLKPAGTPMKDDISVYDKCCLFISEKALNVFKKFELTLAEYIEKT
ncbi:hypothetical protein [Chitinophaga barathri]|uniref:Uncharacterized protein n=1 Tax=Chitinophaga barathri TaxID=1647451 RepID=A0A3N4MGB0_9BACT|nr:hypothetical protein [Chitinophaga barathri]RPD42465.1 hypothetical protein EG028_04630 [Chitinophaga barathri]